MLTHSVKKRHFIIFIYFYSINIYILVLSVYKLETEWLYVLEPISSSTRCCFIELYLAGHSIESKGFAETVNNFSMSSTACGHIKVHRETAR